MRDLHSHLLPGVDDGAVDLEEAKNMLDALKAKGFDSVILTPNYVLESKFVSNVNTNKKIFETVKEYANEKEIKVYLGNEVFINNNLIDLIKKKEIMTLNNSRYLLLELPMSVKSMDVKSICLDLKNIGITPIIAHPERYTKYNRDLSFFVSLRMMGVLLQINLPSLNGFYGRAAKRQAKMLLKNNLVSFVGTDLHHIEEGNLENIDKAVKKLRKYVGKFEAEKILNTNYIKVINNEEL